MSRRRFARRPVPWPVQRDQRSTSATRPSRVHPGSGLLFGSRHRVGQERTSDRALRRAQDSFAAVPPVSPRRGHGTGGRLRAWLGPIGDRFRASPPDPAPTPCRRPRPSPEPSVADARREKRETWQLPGVRRRISVVGAIRQYPTRASRCARPRANARLADCALSRASIAAARALSKRCSATGCRSSPRQPANGWRARGPVAASNLDRLAMSRSIRRRCSRSNSPSPCRSSSGGLRSLAMNPTTSAMASNGVKSRCSMAVWSKSAMRLNSSRVMRNFVVWSCPSSNCAQPCGETDWRAPRPIDPGHSRSA